MTTILQISKLSWRAIEQGYPLDKYEEELEKIIHQPWNYTLYIVAIGTGFACGGFCKLFGCDWMAFLFASTCAFVRFRVRARCVETGLDVYMSIAAAAFVSTYLAYAPSFSGLSGAPYHPLLAYVLFIVPGVPLINFVGDMLDNHLLAGITRTFNTVMVVTAMTFGIAFAMRILVMNDVEMDHKFSELNMVPHDSYYMYALAATTSAIGFPIVFSIQRRLLWMITMGDITAIYTRNLVNFELGYSPMVDSFIGSFVVSLLAIKAVHQCHVPSHVLTVPSVIPMIPGVLMYRSLLAFISLHGVVGEATNVFFSGVNSALIILCISFDVAVPNIFVRRYITKDRQRRLQEGLERRRERGRFIKW